MGCPLDGGDNVNIEVFFFLGQGGFCFIHSPKSTKFQSKTFKKYVKGSKVKLDMQILNLNLSCSIVYWGVLLMVVRI